MLLQRRRRDPSRRMFRVRFHEGVEEHACALDVTNFGVGFENDGVEGGEVAFWVDGGGGAGGGCGAGDLRGGRRGERELVKWGGRRGGEEG